LEAITSRPLLLQAVGRLVSTGRRKIIRLTSTHAMADRIRLTLESDRTVSERLGANCGAVECRGDLGHHLVDGVRPMATESELSS
jgi:hypothetical protein